MPPVMISIRVMPPVSLRIRPNASTEIEPCSAVTVALTYTSDARLVAATEPDCDTTEFNSETVDNPSTVMSSFARSTFGVLT